MSQFGKFEYTEASKKKLIIFGDGEFARIASLYFKLDSPYEVVGNIIDEKFFLETSNPKDTLFCLEKDLDKFPSTEYSIFVAISGKELSYPRIKKIEELKSKGYELASYVSSRAFVFQDCFIGENVFIFENNNLQSQVSIGDGVVLWSGNHVGHLTNIEAGCFLTSHVCIGGNSRIMKNSYFGMNSTVRDQILVNAQTVVGANTYINKDTPGNCVMFGNPAKVIPGLDPMAAV